MNLEKKFDRVYENLGRYAIIPVVLVFISVLILGGSYLNNGEFLDKGLDFTGGTEVTYRVAGDFQTSEIEQIFADRGWEGANALTLSREGEEEDLLLVQVPPPEIDNIESAEQIMEEEGYNATAEGFSSLSSAVSGQFFQSAIVAFGLAFSIMSLVIFAAFKDFVPSTAVILAATGDIVVAASGMALLGIDLTLGSFAALLMLIGYSVDTDIVLSTRVLKRERGSLKERIWSSVKTGVTMSAGGIAGFAILFLMSYSIVGPSELSNIASVMVIGLLADMPLTWFGNTYILKKHVQEGFDLRGRLPWN